jgi:hypothetical protein
MNPETKRERDFSRVFATRHEVPCGIDDRPAASTRSTQLVITYPMTEIMSTQESESAVRILKNEIPRDLLILLIWITVPNTKLFGDT